MRWDELTDPEGRQFIAYIICTEADPAYSIINRYAVYVYRKIIGAFLRGMEDL